MFRLRIWALLINSLSKYGLATHNRGGPQAGRFWVPNTFLSRTQILDL